MIRLFTALCKTMLDSLTDEDLYYDATEGFSCYDKPCPQCGAIGKLAPYGDYSRWLVSFFGKVVTTKRIQPLRFECKSCGTTHALLPDILIPYSPYSLRFKLSALIAYFERDSTVVAVCERFGIAVSTIYEWKKLFLSHKELLLGVLVSRKTPALAFLRSLFESANLSLYLHRFFCRYGSSFLQAQSMSATPFRPP